jgi:two-component system, chemotaxis family, CheB/CheR fusion protein
MIPTDTELVGAEPEGEGGALSEDVLSSVVALLRAERGVDFSLYRPSTIARRVRRRMSLGRVESAEVYLQMLKASPAERAALHRDVLVKVTSFFRDPELFEALAESVLPALLRGHARDAPLRIWVPGCATGEEAYSIAIVLAEALPPGGAPVQIFATDADEESIEAARAGVYPESIALDVSPERLSRHFRRTGEGLQIGRAVRELCVFARHDVTSDPPFARLDLVSCRNLLLYFEPALQKKVLGAFHFALRPEGVLLLGANEAPIAAPELFAPAAGQARIYRRLHVERPEPAPRRSARRPSARALAEDEIAGPPSPLGAADRVLLRRYAPAGAVIDGDFRIIEFRGQTSPYLQPAPGEASLHLIKMAREGLGIELRGAVQKAKRTGEPVRVEGLSAGEDRAPVAVEVIPFDTGGDLSGDPPERWYLVVFEEEGAPRSRPMDAGATESGPRSAATDRRVAQLEKDLAAARSYLTTMLEEHEATNEELASANEELAASNEALEILNEALTQARDELGAASRELAATNEELLRNNAELSRLNEELVRELAARGPSAPGGDP